MADFQLKIFTPAGLLLDDTTSEVKLPSAVGEIGVLPQHTRYCGLIGDGILEFWQPGQKARRVKLSGGFCSFADQALVILADQAEIQ